MSIFRSVFLCFNQKNLGGGVEPLISPFIRAWLMVVGVCHNKCINNGLSFLMKTIFYRDKNSLEPSTKKKKYLDSHWLPINDTMIYVRQITLMLNRSAFCSKMFNIDEATYIIILVFSCRRIWQKKKKNYKTHASPSKCFFRKKSTTCYLENQKRDVWKT